MFDGISNSKMRYACIAFYRIKKNTLQSENYTKINSRTYQLLKVAYSEEARKRLGSKNHFHGKSHTEEAKLKMRKPKTHIKNMGKYIRTVDIRELASKSRTGKGLAEKNSMNSQENHNKVGNSKLGRKRYYNRSTGEYIYQYPKNVDLSIFCTAEEYRSVNK